MYTRSTTIAAVEGLTLADLDRPHDEQSNTVGAGLLDTRPFQG